MDDSITSPKNYAEVLSFELEGPLLAILVFAIGCFLCFFGYRFFKLTISFISFAYGFILCTSIVSNIFSQPPQHIMLIIGLLAGLFCAILVNWVYYIGIFLLGASGGLVIGGIFATGLSGWTEIIVLLFLAFICGLLAFRYQQIMLAISTALLGGLMIIAGSVSLFIGTAPTKSFIENMIANGPNGVLSWLILVFFVILGLLGMAVQLKLSQE